MTDTISLEYLASAIARAAEAGNGLTPEQTQYAVEVIRRAIGAPINWPTARDGFEAACVAYPGDNSLRYAFISGVKWAGENGNPERWPIYPLRLEPYKEACDEILAWLDDWTEVSELDALFAKHRPYEKRQFNLDVIMGEFSFRPARSFNPNGELLDAMRHHGLVLRKFEGRDVFYKSAKPEKPRFPAPSPISPIPLTHGERE